MGDYDIGDPRWDGYSNEELAGQVDGMHNGPGGSSLIDAMVALSNISGALAKTDQTLHDQLTRLHVSWQSNAADGAQQTTTTAGQYAVDAQGPIDTSGRAIDGQGESFAQTKNNVPTPQVLRGPTTLNVGDKLAGSLLGHTTDHARAVEQTRQSRQDAVRQLNQYTDTSQQNLGTYQPLPAPDPIKVEPAPVAPDPGSTSVSGYNSGGIPVGPSGSQLPSPGIPSVPAGGGAPITAPIPRLDGNPVNVPGGTGGPPVAPGPVTPGPVGPGVVSGAGPAVPGNQGGGFGLGPRGLPGPALNSAEVGGLIGGGVGAAGLGGALSERDKLTRGALPAGEFDEHGRPVNRGNTLGALNEEEAAGARAAERVSARVKPGSSMMEPAAGGRGAKGEDDDEHVRKYGVDSDDVFGDERLVAQPVLGDDAAEQ